MSTRETLAQAALAHLDGLHTLARWLARDPTEAEDLVQETYLRALRGAAGFEAGTNLRAWLFRILRNTFYTRYRRRAREPKAADEATLDALAAREGPVGSGHSGGIRLDLEAALQQLPEEYRSVVVLADVEELRMAEIAGIMECPVGTVKSRLSRGRALLRALLGDYLPG